VNEPELRSEPTGWLDTVTLEGADQPVRVVLDERDGHRVFLRQADPSDGDSPRVPLYEGDEMVVMTAIAYVGEHLTDEVGRIDDLLAAARIVPVRREPGRVFVRTLRYGEPDIGDRVHVRPGDAVTFEEGALVIELDAIDSAESEGASGYVPITPALWTWLAMTSQDDEVRFRYLFAAARRLDAANVLLSDVERRRAEAAQEGLAGPAKRRALFGLISATELAIVAVGRVCDMVVKARERIGTDVAVPPTLASKAEAVTKIRDSYEHVEDRALGNVRRKPHQDALSIFNHEELVIHGRARYGSHSLDLAHDVPTLIAEARQFLKDVAGNP